MALNHFQEQRDINTNRKQATFIYYVLHVAFRVFRATFEAFSYKYIVLLTAYCKIWNGLDLLNMDWICKTWICKTWNGLLKQGLLTDGFVKYRFQCVIHELVKHGFEWICKICKSETGKKIDLEKQTKQSNLFVLFLCRLCMRIHLSTS